MCLSSQAPSVVQNVIECNDNIGWHADNEGYKKHCSNAGKSLNMLTIQKKTHTLF